MAQQRIIIQTRHLKSYPKQLTAAEQNEREGDLLTACLIYARIAVSRPPTAYSELAQKQLRKLQENARNEFKAVDLQLAAAQSTADEHPDQIAELFQQYRDLTQKYAGVPVVNKELTKHVTKQRRDPKYAAALGEAEARRLWGLAQQYEADENWCCAHEVYSEASLLLPAKTATLAMARLLELKSDPILAVKVAECRNLQESHNRFQIAESRQLPK